MIPQGIAFHNASLSLQDRSIVERLFLELKIKVLCTTSTLSMGINLPARLVVIKSTQCYRGSMKGYQEYTKIETDQMMGRAGRPPFDNQGTVVIMTEKSNYNRYNRDLEL
jgi:ATP-dependent DNA helicase HFM1/MER3